MATTDEIRIRLSLQGREGFRSDVSGAQEDLRGLGGAANDGADTAGGAFDSISSAGAASALAVGAAFATAFVAIGTGIGSVVDDFSTAQGQMQARLGLTAEDAAEFNEIASNVYGNNFGESMGDVTGQVSALHQALGLTGSDLQSATEDVFSITDAFGDMGAEPAAIAEAVRVMTSAFDGMNAEQALDLITSGFQTGAGASGDMLDSLGEYSGLMSDLGLSGEEVLGAFDAGLENGARNTDLMADAFGEFGKLVKAEGSTAQEAIAEMFGVGQADQLVAAISEGGPAARDAFGQISEGLAGIADENERYNTAVALFGTQAEDLGPALMPMLEGITSGTEDATGATDTLAAQYGGFGNFFSGVGRKVETGIADAFGPLIKEYQPALDDLTERIGPAIGTAFSTLERGGRALGAWLSPFVQQWIAAWPEVSRRLQDAWGYIVPAFQWLGQTIRWVWDFLIWPVVVQWRDVYIPTLVGAIQWAWPILRDAFTAIGAQISMVWDTYIVPAYYRWVNEIWPAIVVALSDARTAMQPILQSVGTTIQQVWDDYVRPAMTFWVQELWPGIQTAISGAWTVVEGVFNSIASGVETARENWRALRDTVSGVWSTIQERASTAWDWVQENVLKPMQTGLATISETVGSIPGFGTGGGTTADTLSSSTGLAATPLPRLSAERILTATGGGGQAPVTINYAPTVQAIDDESVRRFFAENRELIADELVTAVGRRGVTH